MFYRISHSPVNKICYCALIIFQFVLSAELVKEVNLVQFSVKVMTVHLWQNGKMDERVMNGVDCSKVYRKFLYIH